MSVGRAPKKHKQTRVRQLLQQAEILRYRWEYKGRLASLRRQGLGRSRLLRDEIQSIRDYWGQRDLGRANLQWYRLFKSLTGHVDPRYIPEELFRTRMEPLLCRRDVALAYHDKNQLDRQYPHLTRPKTIIRNIYGKYYDEEYTPIPKSEISAHLKPFKDRLFIKPSISGTGSGQNVISFAFGEDETFDLQDLRMTIEDVERIYCQDFLVQQGLAQHPDLAKFHTGSLNTLRVITLRLDEQLFPLAVTFRMGNGSEVDNGHAGGLLCGVDIASGELTNFACDVHFRRFDFHPLSGIAFANQRLPSIAAVVAMAIDAHQQMLYFDQISCDIAVLPDASPCLLEVNPFGQGVEPHQFLCGGPLFGEHTERVLDLVSNRNASGWNL